MTSGRYIRAIGWYRAPIGLWEGSNPGRSPEGFGRRVAEPVNDIETHMDMIY